LFLCYAICEVLIKKWDLTHTPFFFKGKIKLILISEIAAGPHAAWVLADGAQDWLALMGWSWSVRRPAWWCASAQWICQASTWWSLFSFEKSTDVVLITSLRLV
jgi:hypothetical protein